MNRSSTSGFVRRILSLFQLQGTEQARSDTEQGSRELDSQGEGTTAAINFVETENDSEGSKDTLRLLLCSTSGLHQEVLKSINDDRELFIYLRRQFFSKRAWFTFRSVGAVSLTKVSNVEHEDFLRHKCC
jgi:hypothetical protein